MVIVMLIVIVSIIIASIKDNSIDIILTFHQLEHVYDLTAYLLEIKRILKLGLLIGSVPTEGSFA